MLKQRVITAAVLLVLFAFFVFLAPPVFFSLFVSLIAAVAGWEWARLSFVLNDTHRVAYAVLVGLVSLVLLVFSGTQPVESYGSLLALVFWSIAIARLVLHPVRKTAGTGTVTTSGTPDRALLLAGVFVLCTTAVALQALHHTTPGASPWLLLYALAIVWAMDIGAYFSGRRFGRNKLAPSISPGKTREGVYGGLICALLLMLLALAIAPTLREVAGKLLTATTVAAFSSVAGDLFESRLKRAAGVKDSSQLLPGHGGVLDRIDGVVAALPLFLCIWIWS